MADDNPGYILSASNFIHDERRNAPFGLDGNSSIAELRPGPASDPLQHVELIRAIFYDAARSRSMTQLWRHTLHAGNTQSPTGGHIHIGHPAIAKRDGDNWNASLKREQKIKALVASLDTLLCLPIAFTEDPRIAKYRKTGSGYGKLGDYRTDKPYGIEYRTPPSWIASEKLAKGVISTAYTIAWQVLERDYDASELRDTEGYDMLYNKHMLGMLRPLLPHMVSEVRKMELYPFYKPHIEYLLGSALRGITLFNTDIRRGWSIPYIKVRKAVLLSIQSLVAHMVDNILEGSRPQENDYKFIVSRSADWQIPQIRSRVNDALNRALEKHYDETDHGTPNRVYIYGRNKEHGDVITIEYNTSIIYTRRILRMVRLINDVLRAFNYPDTIRIQASGSRRMYGEPGVVMRVGIGRPLREFNKYAAEAVAFICVLYANNAIYKAYRTHKKTGRKVTLPLIARSVIPGMKKLIEQDKPLTITPERESELRARMDSLYSRRDDLGDHCEDCGDGDESHEVHMEAMDQINRELREIESEIHGTAQQQRIPVSPTGAVRARTTMRI